MNIYLIRHGKTPANEQRIYCGSTDMSLSEGGIDELKNLSYNIKNVRFLTSGMKRTNETLKVLFGDVPFEEDHRFREIDFGVFEMHSYEELKDREDYQQWITGDHEANIPPEGESGRQMMQRVLAAFSEIKEDTVLIAHGGVISAIMQHCFPGEGKHLYQWQPKNGCGYLLSGGTYQAIP